MINLLGAGNPYIRRYAAGGEVSQEKQESPELSAGDIYSIILDAKLRPLYEEWDQARQQQQQQSTALNQKYNSPEAQQQFQKQYEDEVKKIQNSFVQQEWQSPFWQNYFSRAKEARDILQDVVAGKYGPGSQVGYTDPEFGSYVGIRLSAPGQLGKPYPEDIFLAQQRLDYFNRLLTNPETGKSWEFDPNLPNKGVPQAVTQAAENTILGLNVDIFGEVYNRFWGNLAQQEQAELDAFGKRIDKENLGFQAQIDSRAKSLGPQVDAQLNQYWKMAQDYNVPYTTKDLLGAFGVAEKTPVSDFFLGTLMPTSPGNSTPSFTAPTSAPTQPPPTSVPAPVIGQQPSAPSIPVGQAPSQPPSVPPSSITPLPLPGITPPPAIGGIPQPSIGYQNPLYQSVLPQYQSPTSTAMQPTQPTQPTQQQQSQQPQFQYGPIGQAAVGQTNLLQTLLSQQQDPTQVSLLGFDNPYLMKPFG